MGGMRELFDRFGSDKGRRHAYERVYEPAFEAIRNEPLRVLEIGILKGASIKTWLEYFPNAMIFGIDTFDEVGSNDIAVLEHPRVEWWKHDSTTPADFGKFDIIIDDGNHEHAAQRKTLECFAPCANMYFIEDVWAFGRMTLKEKEHKWLERGGYSDRGYQELLDALEPYDVEFHDLRAGHQPDSFIISVL